jgi:AbrB family looped-hinge helix DNA binding protein
MKEEIISTVSKGQMVVPRAIKSRMGLKPGDKIRYSVKGSKVEIEKLSGTESFDPFVAFTEWSSDADDEAFCHLKPKKN